MITFRLEDRFASSLERIEALLLGPELHPRLAQAMPAIHQIEPLEREEDERQIRRRVRYVPEVGDKIPAFARAVVRPSMLAWVEESTFDKARHRFEYRILPNIPEGWRDRFASHGWYQLEPEAGGVKRTIEGSIEVRVPLFGGKVEKLLRREVTENFRAEAAALARWLAEGV